ncbi:hypothetical protein [Pseudoxanthomonas sacheonensis]|uniref:Transmembrane protein n=1 Tax=Pseudoxanthomonas sacheonensis TaxID=443615 RepID=A0ABU1RNS7_9GAMM|nr:hypothetical protein [Pseudoxanthomonas sacheonensis]MDR6840429.1 hypothetical protein [Pseudoxanthomonas sacheonensis]
MLDSTLVISSLALALAAFVIFLIWRTKFLLIVSSTLLTASLFIWGIVVWFLRDGMGPDAIESSGLQAWSHFLEFFWMPIVFWAFLIIVSIVVSRAGKK